MTWTSQAIAVFDLETTGVDVSTSRIVSAHIGLIKPDGSVASGTDYLLDPGVEIPVQASAVHGITTDYARQHGEDAATAVRAIAGEIDRVLTSGTPLVIYNAPYDLSLLHAECVRHGVKPLTAPRPIIDPLVIDRAVDRYRKGKRTLLAACAAYGVTLDNAHDASSDAVAAGLLALAIGHAYPEALEMTAYELHDAQVEWARRQAEDFQAYMRRARDPEFVANGRWPLRN